MYYYYKYLYFWSRQLPFAVVQLEFVAVLKALLVSLTRTCRSSNSKDLLLLGSITSMYERTWPLAASAQPHLAF